MTSTLVIPSLGNPALEPCLAAVAQLDPAPVAVVVVLSGPGADRRLPAGMQAIRCRRRLGFAPAVNAGLAAVAAQAPFAAILNDDALPPPHWLGVLEGGLGGDAGAAAVQGSVTDGDGRLLDGCGVGFDRWWLPVQLGRRDPAEPEPPAPRPVTAVSGTAALLRVAALEQVQLAGGEVLDPAFGSYLEDVDLGLRLARLGWRAAWLPGAPVRHLGSVSGRRLPWRRPWWLLANRWRLLAGNLTPQALLAALPRLLRGELRALATLARQDARAALVAPAVALSWPWLVVQGWRRRTPGPRLAALPEPP